MENRILSRNNVKIYGEGEQSILFAHGFGCDQNMWRFVTPAFEDDYKVVLFDYVGSGKSDIKAYNSQRYSSLKGYAQDVIDILDALELEKAIFVGHSVSSMIGALAAIEIPGRFESLVMIGPSPCYLNFPPEYFGGYDRETILELLTLMEKNYIGWANFFAPEIMQKEDRPELSKELEESFCSTDPIIAREFAEVTFLSDNRNDLPKISTPTLIVQCSNDPIAPVEIGKYVHSKLEKSDIEVISASGHCPHLSHPEKTISVIEGYLRSKNK